MLSAYQSQVETLSLVETHQKGYNALYNKHFTQAAHWFRQAAEKGYSPSQNHLGRLYRDGIGVKQDQQQAAFWFGKATQQNRDNQDSRSNLSPDAVPG